MTESGYYPPGAEFDPNAPYNQVETEPIDLQVSVSNTLSKTITLKVNDYVADDPEKERDEDGNITIIGGEIHTDCCDLKGQFREQYMSIPDILESIIKLSQHVKKDGWTENHARYFNNIAKEAENWTEDEFEIVEE